VQRNQKRLVTIRIGEQQHRVEQVLSVARVFLAAAALLAVHLVSLGGVRYATRLLLLTYFVYSVIVMLWLRASGRGQHPAVPLVLHSIDILAPAIIVPFSAGLGSSFMMFLVFALVAAGYRWGLRETLITTGIAILVASAAAVLSYHTKHPGFVVRAGVEANRLVSRIAYLLALGFLLGKLAENEKRMQAESMSIASLLAKVRPDQGLRRTLQVLRGGLAQIFSADAVLLAVE